MRTVTTYPRPIRELDPVWIPLGDGVRLAARVWLPEDAERRPVPAVLEYLPYRRRDFTAPRDALAGFGRPRILLPDVAADQQRLFGRALRLA